jgi:hypothetical protein
MLRYRHNQKHPAGTRKNNCPSAKWPRSGSQVDSRKGEEMSKSIDQYEAIYGAVVFKGKKYILTDQAEHTNRLLPYNGYNDPDDCGNYDFEVSASAIDEKGTEYMVYWIFNTEKDEDGNSKELDEYNYDDVSRVELR